MSFKVRRTEHAGYLTGADGQKEHENKKTLKWDSNHRRRQQFRQPLRYLLQDVEDNH